jgi:FixJ family two-component response regulator
LSPGYSFGKRGWLLDFKVFKCKKNFTPVIFLTAQGDQEKAVEAMKAGATDYLIKSNLSVVSLAHSIRSVIKLEGESTKGNSRAFTQDSGRIIAGDFECNA